jgi:fucose 4-O-acetylase-like acetyltransferase
MTRNYKVDNARFFLIFFVIFGHIIASYNDQVLFGYLLKIIFMFHMPLFVTFSGYYSNLLDDLYYSKIIVYIIVPYILLETYYAVGGSLVSGREPITFLYTVPNYALWYLLSLATWKLLLPFMIKIPQYVFVSFAIGLIAGFFNDLGHGMSLSRSLYFFPFFLLGYWGKNVGMKIEVLEKNKFLIAIVALSLMLAVFFMDFHYSLLLGNKSYSALSFTPWTGFGVRGLIYIATLVIGCFFFIIMPNEANFTNRFGRATFLIYAYHIIFIRVFRVSGFSNYLETYVSKSPFLFMFLFALMTSCIIFLIGNQRVLPLLRKTIIPDFMLTIFKLKK